MCLNEPFLAPTANVCSLFVAVAAGLHDFTCLPSFDSLPPCCWFLLFNAEQTKRKTERMATKLLTAKDSDVLRKACADDAVTPALVEGICCCTSSADILQVGVRAYGRVRAVFTRLLFFSVLLVCVLRL